MTAAAGGSGRRPEPVEHRRRIRAAANATASVLAELPGPLAPAFARDLEQAVDGTISADELYRRTLARHRRDGWA